MRRIILVLAILAAMPVYPQERQLTMEDGGQLNLTRMTSDELQGEFSKAGRTLSFHSILTHDRVFFALLENEGMLVLKIETEPSDVNRIIINVMNEQLVAEGQRSETDWPSITIRKGSSDALVKLQSSAAYRALPNLSIELVRREVTGLNVPASSYIHGLAVVSARAQGLSLPQIPQPRTLFQRLFDIGECRTLRSDPFRDDCYGMCGYSCVCWWPICGTCCGCEGCYRHDWSCRVNECRYEPAEQVGCHTFATFFLVKIPVQHTMGEGGCRADLPFKVAFARRDSA